MISPSYTADMAEKAANRAPDARETTPNPPARSIRGADGRFVPGHPGGPGRPRGASLLTELRRQADPERIVEQMLGMLNDPDVGHRERTQILGMVWDRLEGRAVNRSISIRAEQPFAYPATWDSLSPGDRRKYLLAARARLLGDGGIDDE